MCYNRFSEILIKIHVSSIAPLILEVLYLITIRQQFRGGAEEASFLEGGGTFVGGGGGGFQGPPSVSHPEYR